MHEARILVVEDDRTIAEGLREAFTSEGARVELAFDGDEGRRRLAEGVWDCVLLDLMLPGPSGIDLLRDLRARDTATPVVLLTARGHEADKVLGLELGADDYVTKPFSLRELLARVRAALRRSPRLSAGSGRGAVAGPRRFTVGDAEVDLDALVVRRPGRGEAALSPREAELLAFLWQERGRVLSRDEILDAVWGRVAATLHRTIDTHVLRLRKKLEPDPRRPRHLRTAHGAGYRLDAGTGTRDGVGGGGGGEPAR